MDPGKNIMPTGIASSCTPRLSQPDSNSQIRANPCTELSGRVHASSECLGRKTYLCHLFEAVYMNFQRKNIASPFSFAWLLLPVNFYIPE